MARARLEGEPAKVRRVEEQFARWRAGKQGQERIPARLWEAAANLCGSYSIHRVSRWLRINHTSLQERAGRRSSPRPSPRKPAFVEWSLPAGIAAGASSAEYVVEVPVRGDGTQRIHVRGAGVAEVAALARALRGEG
ncbi:MAG: hypothetical protein HY928_02600 [Elusimicrobia bacterium]|nr:hypothetical protein [Elusimicrobiota bacterium]